jgi:hypothetical protein
MVSFLILKNKKIRLTTMFKGSKMKKITTYHMNKNKI